MKKRGLEQFLNHTIIVYPASHLSSFRDEPPEEGILHDFDPLGVYIEQETIVFIPFTSIRKLEIEPKPSFWQRLTGTS
ncbi:hypothetical protein [Brevibacillus dissolubilis]|uniref:hypothetical protein n=1 Tax=Brevibacillus dissolubilis TaxID=1844116 RepID=UPI001116367A|nr:hypothetical protein [Brevibacillus dissolubilis]